MCDRLDLKGIDPFHEPALRSECGAIRRYWNYEQRYIEKEGFGQQHHRAANADRSLLYKTRYPVFR